MYKPLVIGLVAAFLLFVVLFSSLLAVLLSPDQVAMAKVLATVFRNSKQYKAQTRGTKPPGYVIIKSKGPMEVIVDTGPEWSISKDFKVNLLDGKATTKEPEPEDEFHKQILAAHNIYRERHEVAPLTMSEKISNFATEWATILARDKKAQFRTPSPYGENLYPVAINAFPTATSAVLSWYSTIQEYVFGKETTSYSAAINISTFAQIVWKNTKELGCGFSFNSTAKFKVIVCDYYPPGKVLGSYLRNVKRPKDMSEDDFPVEDSPNLNNQNPSTADK